MEHKDATPMNNKLEYIESDFDMEDIVLKPSVELIPDEYEHTDNKAALVHIFRGEYKHDVINTERVRLSLQKLGYDIPFENVHFIRKRKQVQEDLDESMYLLMNTNLCACTFLIIDYILFSCK